METVYGGIISDTGEVPLGILKCCSFDNFVFTKVC